MAKSKYESHVKEKFHEIEQWLKQGLAEYQIFKNLGIGKTTWNKYKNKHPELKELLKKGKEVQISEVENALFKNATGHFYTETQAIKLKSVSYIDGKRHEEERVEVVEVQKYKPAETGAIAFFLKNRDRKNYADNPHMADIRKEELELKKKEAENKVW